MASLSSPTSPDAVSSASQPDLAVAEVIGRLMHFWGFKRPMGRVWSVLYLSAQPQTAVVIGEILQMSAGAVSMALGELEKWGAILRSSVPGDRRDYFSAESDIWKLVRTVMKQRELNLVREFALSLKLADEILKSQENSEKSEFLEACDLANNQELRYKRERLARLIALSHAGESLLAALVEGATINPSILSNTGTQA